MSYVQPTHDGEGDLNVLGPKCGKKCQLTIPPLAEATSKVSLYD